MKYEGKALTIGVSDPKGGSGLDTDLNIFCSFKVFSISIPTAVLSKTKSGEEHIHTIPTKVTKNQITSIIDEFTFDGLKVGMVPNEKIVDNILNNIKKHDLNNLVLDPVLSDDRITYKNTEKYIIEKLLPESFIVILDITEAEMISETDIEDQDDAERAAKFLYGLGPKFVFIRSGDLNEESSDVLYDGDTFHKYDGYETSQENKKEADCTFSGAVTANLSKGIDVNRSIDIAMDYVRRAILSSNKRFEKDKKHLDLNIEPLEVSAFEEEASDFDSWFENNKNVFESEFKAEEKLMVDPENAVSIGVGSGLFASRLGIKHGVEPASGMAELAREKGIKVIKGRAEDLPIKDEEYETVLMSTVLSYVDDPQKTVDEAFRVLKSGGHVIISFLPKEGSYTMLYDLAIMRGRHDPEMSPEHPYPLKFIKGSRWLSTEKVTELMKNAGFKDLKYVQTLTKHPKYTNEEVEEPVKGYKKGDYVVIRGEKP
ncbi:MAG: bifunctional hydroxymethylpyrimidine kinase/phosphomethylpyrimidine kinase [Thermoplasmatota archaeon]